MVLQLEGESFWCVWMLKWMGRKECVGYVGKLEEVWPIKATGAGEGLA